MMNKRRKALAVVTAKVKVVTRISVVVPNPLQIKWDCPLGQMELFKVQLNNGLFLKLQSSKNSTAVTETGDMKNCGYSSKVVLWVELESISVCLFVYMLYGLQ